MRRLALGLLALGLLVMAASTCFAQAVMVVMGTGTAMARRPARPIRRS